MKIFGDKNQFAIEYTFYAFNKCEFKIYIDNKSICTFMKNNIIYEFKWDIREIVEWFEMNLEYILNENYFPLDVLGNTSIELYKNSGEIDFEDENEFYNWYEKRQDWSFRHSWFASRAGGYLADVYFRKVEGNIEISWDNSNSFDNIKFLNPSGVYYFESKLFKNIVENFVKSFKYDI